MVCHILGLIKRVPIADLKSVFLFVTRLPRDISRIAACKCAAYVAVSSGTFDNIFLLYLLPPSCIVTPGGSSRCGHNYLCMSLIIGVVSQSNLSVQNDEGKVIENRYNA